MSVEENKALVRRFFEEVLNTRKLSVIDQLYATDVVDHTAPAGQAPGLAGLKQTVAMILAALPDAHLTIEDMIAQEDRVAVRYTVRATHTGGAFFSISPTGKQVTVTGIFMARISGGKIVDKWGNQDDLGMLQQLGVILSREEAK